jgi:hypothetical protein
MERIHGTHARRILILAAIHFASSPAAVLYAQDVQPAAIEHVIVFDQQGRYGGWPANNGLWSWGDEVLVGFDDGHFFVSERNRSGRGHAIDYDRPVRSALARSLNGGETWTVEYPPGLQPPPGIRIAGIPVPKDGPALRPLTEPIPFDEPGFALTIRMSSATGGDSRFYYSLDRGHTWKGPFSFPNLGTRGVHAQADYFVEGPRKLLAFVSAATDEGQRVIAVRTRDGGLTWEHESTVGPGNEPSSIRLSESEIVTALRSARRVAGNTVQTVEGYRSTDNGASWTHTGTIADTHGNFPDLVRLRDGRLACLYGYRAPPYGIRGRLSEDEGISWGPEFRLRSDGGHYDLGYPITAQRADGMLVTVYYFNHGLEDERFVAATIWSP